MSKTPMTDANLQQELGRTHVYAPSIEFTRRLEEDRAALVEALRDAIAALELAEVEGRNAVALSCRALLARMEESNG